jgi:hypothetical protein
MGTEWFSAWRLRQLAVCLTFARGYAWAHVLEAFAIDPAGAREMTWTDALAAPDGDIVRAGTRGAWGYAVEASSAEGRREDVLASLSRGKGEAFVLSYTPTVQTFVLARDGVTVCAFDLLLPANRWGTDPHALDAQMQAVGIVHPGDDPAAAGSRLIELLTGISLDANLIERPLPGAPLPR